MSYDAKTDWKYNDPVTEDDFNRIEQGIKDAHEMVENQTNDLTAHKNNDTRHITQQERNKWNNKVSQDDFDEAVNDITSQLTQLANEFNELRTLFVATGPVQTIPNATNTFLTFSNVTSSDFAILENGRIKIVKQGVYDIRLNVHFATNANGMRQIIVHSSANSVSSPPVSDLPTRLHCSRVTPIENETLLLLSAYQTSGSNLDVVSLRCTIQKVG